MIYSLPETNRLAEAVYFSEFDLAINFVELPEWVSAPSEPELWIENPTGRFTPELRALQRALWGAGLKAQLRTLVTPIDATTSAGGKLSVSCPMDWGDGSKIDGPD